MNWHENDEKWTQVERALLLKSKLTPVCDHCGRKFLGTAVYQFTKRPACRAARWTCTCLGCKTQDYSGMVYVISRWDLSFVPIRPTRDGTVIAVGPCLPMGAQWQLDEDDNIVQFEAELGKIWAGGVEVFRLP
jgi:hypothetical protein